MTLLRKTVLAFLVLGPLAYVVWCTRLLSPFGGPGFSGQVVDVITGLPVSNAVVELKWTAVRGRIHGYRSITILTARLAVTNDGRFGSPAWGPVWPKGLDILKPWERLNGNMYVTAPGYKPRTYIRIPPFEIAQPSWIESNSFSGAGTGLVELTPADVAELN